MPRKRHLISYERPYHVTSRTNNQEWFRLNMDETWEIFSNQLFLLKHSFNLQIHAFVLMSNHFHLLITTPDGNLSQAMQYFLGEISREIGRRQKSTNHIFKQKYFRSLIPDERGMLAVYRYIYQNPMRAGISKKAHLYKYSTLGPILGLSHCMIPINDNILFSYGDWVKMVGWINEAPSAEITESVKRGLKMSQFEFAKSPATRRKLIPELPALKN